MARADLVALLPWILLAAAPVAVMLLVAIRRSHPATAALAGIGIVLALLALPAAVARGPSQVTPLVVVDRYGALCTGLLLTASLAVTGLAYGYLRSREVNREEFYILLLLATLGSAVLVASNHFASFFLGFEILSVSLYALIAYPRRQLNSIEAGIKYIILAGASSAFLAFGTALVYAAVGSLQFSRLAALAGSAQTQGSRMLVLTGVALLLVGIGFKLAVVPFHLWTPDVYEGAPAPVTAFIATVSKGAIVVLLLRFFNLLDPHRTGSLVTVFLLIALASMIAGNLLALLQNNVKRILAYSSIAHLGYILVAFLASGEMAVTAVTFYLAAYFVTTLGAFGVVTVLSDGDRDADSLADYRGLAWRRPWLAVVLTAMVLSLAGIPITAGFVGKFFLVAAGVESNLWLPVIVLALTSGIGLFYYLRIVIAMFSQSAESTALMTASAPVPVTGGLVLAVLTLLLFWLGVAPGSFIRMLQTMTQGLP
jgi:NADH-quinone oxidoreductase subunit N